MFGGRRVGVPSRMNGQRGDEMKAPDEVSAMVRLSQCGWGTKRIAAHFGCSRHTVKRYLRAGGPTGFRRPSRQALLSDHEEFLRERLMRHRGNADVVRQELLAEKGVAASLRTVESLRLGGIARSCGRKPWLACGSRRRRDGSCRSTSANVLRRFGRTVNSPNNFPIIHNNRGSRVYVWGLSKVSPYSRIPEHARLARRGAAALARRRLGRVQARKLTPRPRSIAVVRTLGAAQVRLEWAGRGRAGFGGRSTFGIRNSVTLY